MREGRLTSKVAVVTGSSSGIGRAIAQTLAREGASVVCFDVVKEAPQSADGTEELDTDDAIRGAGGSSRFVRGDVSKRTDVQRIVEVAANEFGSLDVMVNNAGIWRGIHELVDEDEQIFDDTLAINCKGVWLGCKYALEAMVAQGGGGRIVNIASIAALVGLEGEPAYCASKGAIVSLTRQLAVDYGRHGINVNVICPGFVETPLTSEVHGEGLQEELTPLPRLGTADDVARAALFLSSEDADWITGSVLVVDGGYSAR